MSSINEISRWGMGLDQLDDQDDFSSAWEDCKRLGLIWGGRAKGGRGIRNTNGYTKDVIVDNVTLEFSGKPLLTGASLRFLSGHIYALVGNNGVGKSTLLRRMARGRVPGLAAHLKIVYMQQELPSIPQLTVEEYIKQGISEFFGNSELDRLKEEESRLENLIDSLSSSSDKDCINEIEEATEQLCLVTDQIDELSNTKNNNTCIWSKEDKEVLSGLGLFTNKLSMLAFAMSDLSGGWRMRASLAVTLITARQADVLLLDEVSNHLDLPTLAWLENYLSNNTSHLVVVIVSHDSHFIDGLVTDIAEIRDQQIRYFNGSYSEWVINQNELSAYFTRKIDAVQRKTESLTKSLHNGNQSTGDISKKIERAGYQRNLDGRKYKQYSMKTLDESSYRRAQSLDMQTGAMSTLSSTALQFKLPIPDIDMLRLPTVDAALIELDSCSLKWSNQSNCLLSDVTIQVNLTSRIAIVGANGQGKSTLIQALYSLCDQSSTQSLPHQPPPIETIKKVDTVDNHAISKIKGISLPSKSKKAIVASQVDSRLLLGGQLVLSGKRCYSHRQLKAAIVNQHHIDILANHLSISSIQHVMNCSVGSMSELQARALLGSFGLSGGTPLQPIGSLSGGQKARLALAIVCMNKPHLLLLDEPTNNLSMEASAALAKACESFSGAVVVVSHNRSFLSGVCKQLIVVEKNKAKQIKNCLTNPSLDIKDTTIGDESFDNILDSYFQMTKYNN